MRARAGWTGCGFGIGTEDWTLVVLQMVVPGLGVAGEGREAIAMADGTKGR